MTPPAQPASQVPVPRETTYATNGSGLSGRDKNVLSALAKVLKPGDSVTITGFAYHDAALARKRASVVASFLKDLLKVRMTISINTASRVGKVIVSTTRA